MNNKNALNFLFFHFLGLVIAGAFCRVDQFDDHHGPADAEYQISRPGRRRRAHLPQSFPGRHRRLPRQIGELPVVLSESAGRWRYPKPSSQVARRVFLLPFPFPPSPYPPPISFLAIFHFPVGCCL